MTERDRQELERIANEMRQEAAERRTTQNTISRKEALRLNIL